MWKVLAILILVGIVVRWFMRSRLQDPRLNRDWSDDEAAPYDAPGGPELVENVTRVGSENMGAYGRMLDEPKPRDY